MWKQVTSPIANLGKCGTFSGIGPCDPILTRLRSDFSFNANDSGELCPQVAQSLGVTRG